MKNQIDQTTKLIDKVKKQLFLGILRIIKESLKTTLRNAKDMLAILLLTLYFSSILEAGKYLLRIIISPQEFWYYPLYATTVLSYVVLLFLSMATIYTTSQAHAGKPHTIKDAIFSVVKGTWKRVFLTLFYGVLILIGALSIHRMLFKLTPCLPVSDNCILLIATHSYKAMSYTSETKRQLGSGIGLLDLGPRECLEIAFVAILVYMLAIFGLSLVVSAEEESYEGLSAISRAEELVKGKKVQAWVLTLIYVLCILGVFLLSNFAKRKISSVARNYWTPQVVVVVINSGMWVVSHFRFIVLTVFYHQLKNLCTNMQLADVVADKGKQRDKSE